APVHPVDPQRPGPRTLAGGEAPAVAAVALEAARVAHRVLLLDIGGAPGVLEVIEPSLPHVPVPDPTEVDPEVRHLVDEEGPGVDELVAVDLPPRICRQPRVVAFLGEREGRR